MTEATAGARTVHGQDRVRDPIRTVFVTQWFDPEPGASRGLPLAKWLTGAGHSVRILTGFPNYPGGRVYDGYRVRWRQWQQMDRVRVLRVPLYPSHEYSVRARFLNYASFAASAATIGSALIGPADVGFVYHPPPTVGLPAAVLKATRGIPFAYHISDMWPASVVETGAVGNGRMRRLLEGAIHRWCDFVYRQAAAITVLSPGFKRILVERGVPAHRVHVIYNWVDESIFFPSPRDETLAALLGLSDRFNVIYAGNIGMYQGLDTIVNAALLLRDDPWIQVVIAGTGPDEPRIRDLAQRTGATNVRFLPRRPHYEMGKINDLADVLLVHLQDRPIFRSTIPGKTAVGMSSGRPILMAVRGDAADTIEWSNCGRVVPPQNPARMAEAIRDLSRLSEVERRCLGANGRAYYLEHMGIDTAGARMDDLLRSIRRGPIT
jgi:glycosyltransferase involved in cell wall biosynthesis